MLNCLYRCGSKCSFDVGFWNNPNKNKAYGHIYDVSIVYRLLFLSNGRRCI